ncbi:MAG: hypothetical protein IAG13_36940 [Deltaproteobacteria bacterium]|nr:hypothetical protein [Nannocystaceae bacterium]
MNGVRQGQQLRIGTALLILVGGACGPRAEDAPGGTSTTTGPPGSTGTSTSASSSGGSSSDAADSSTTGAPAPAPEGCTCRERSTDEWPDCDELADIECGGEVLCPELALHCPRANPDLYACERELVYDEEPLDCMLAALRDRTPGKLSTWRPGPFCGLEGCGSDRLEIVVLADGGVVTTECSHVPLSPSESSSAIAVLRDSAYFSDCLELEVARDRYVCMLDGIPYDARVCR